MLDTACARVALGQVATPPAMEDCERHLTLIDTEVGILERESAAGSDHAERLEELRREKAETEARQTELKKQLGRRERR